MSAGCDIDVLRSSLDCSGELFKASGYTLEAVQGLLPQPLHHASRAVAVSDVVPQRRKAIRLAALFHIRELLDIELLIADGAPIVVCVVHAKARSQCPVGSTNKPILPCSAPPC